MKKETQERIGQWWETVEDLYTSNEMSRELYESMCVDFGAVCRRANGVEE